MSVEVVGDPRPVARCRPRRRASAPSPRSTARSRRSDARLATFRRRSLRRSARAADGASASERREQLSERPRSTELGALRPTPASERSQKKSVRRGRAGPRRTQPVPVWGRAGRAWRRASTGPGPAIAAREGTCANSICGHRATVRGHRLATACGAAPSAPWISSPRPIRSPLLPAPRNNVADPTTLQVRSTTQREVPGRPRTVSRSSGSPVGSVRASSVSRRDATRSTPPPRISPMPVTSSGTLVPLPVTGKPCVAAPASTVGHGVDGRRLGRRSSSRSSPSSATIEVVVVVEPSWSSSTIVVVVVDVVVVASVVGASGRRRRRRAHSATPRGCSP